MTMATNTVECQICLEGLNDPRLLPCIHSFCLKCLEDYCRGKLPGDDVPCPMCRNQFQIPKKGVADLPVRTHTKDPGPSTTAVRGQQGYCERHEAERMKMYCLDCNITVCATCCFETHNTHKCERIETVLELTEKALTQLSRSIDEKIKPITSRIECFRDVAAQLEAESNKTSDNIKAIEQKVKQRSQHIKQVLDYKKQLVDRQASDLLRELQSLKSATETEVKPQRNALHTAVTVMEGFVTSLSELRSTGSLNDINEAANTVDDRVKELLERWVIPCEYWAPSYKFTPRNINDWMREDRNMIGQVVEAGASGNIKSYCRNFSATDYVCYSRLSSAILS